MDIRCERPAQVRPTTVVMICACLSMMSCGKGPLPRKQLDSTTGSITIQTLNTLEAG